MKTEIKNLIIKTCNLIISSLDSGRYYENYWNNKHPVSNVTYVGRVLPFPYNDKRVSLDVRTFVQPNDVNIQNWLKKHDFKVVNKLKTDDVVMKAYDAHQKEFFKYAYDEDTFNTIEMWVFPFELRALRKLGKGLDCDDYANSIASMLIAMGVPRYRVRVTAGVTYSGFGHCTVYYLLDDQKTWVHLNSTSPYYIIPENINELPVFGDSKDIIGIKHVWFSYNDKLAWHEFETATAKRTFDRKKYKIV